MNIEYEATFPNINKNEVRKKLKKAGAKLVRPEFMQRRVVFNPPKIKQGAWLRVRDEGDRITMSYKFVPWGSGNKMADQKEVCLKIDDFKAGVEFLKMVGCKKKSYQETLREIWEFGQQVEIVIDTWPYLEPLLEIEGPSERVVKNISSKLGLNYKDAKFCATDQLYHEKYGIPLEKINYHTPLITFNNPNPFKNN